MKRTRTRTIIKEFIYITIGIILVAFSLEFFFIPNNITAGGVSGIGIIVNNYFSDIPVGAIILIMNVVLYIIAFLTLGGGFGAKTLYASFGLSAIMWAMEVAFQPVAFTDDLFINAATGTLIAAVGMTMVFNNGASTGGTDIVAKILNRYLHLDIGKSLLIVDFIIGLAGVLTFGIRIGLYALLCILVNGTMIDRIIDGLNVSKELMIISKKDKEIITFVVKELNRSCTVLTGYGGYTGEGVGILYIVLNWREYIRLRNHIKEIDPRAFISVNDVHEVLGEGFKDLGL